MRKSKKEKLAILDGNNDDENKENNTALIDTLNLSHWKEIHQKQIQQIKQLLADITQATNDHPTKRLLFLRGTHTENSYKKS